MSRRKRKPSGGRPIRALLEQAAAERLRGRAAKVLDTVGDVVPNTLDADTINALGALAFARMDTMERSPDNEYARVFMAVIAMRVQVLDESGRLVGHVHDFLNRNPVYLTGLPLEIAKAAWLDLVWRETEQIVDRYVDETDANGEPRMLRGSEGKLYHNPDYEGD